MLSIPTLICINIFLLILYVHINRKSFKIGGASIKRDEDVVYIIHKNIINLLNQEFTNYSTINNNPNAVVEPYINLICMEIYKSYPDDIFTSFSHKLEYVHKDLLNIKKKVTNTDEEYMTYINKVIKHIEDIKISEEKIEMFQKEIDSL